MATQTLPREELLDRLVDAIVARQLLHPTRVAIDGVDGAGKTSLANELVKPVEARGKPVIRVSIDGFHNPSAVRRARGKESPEGYYLDSFNQAQVIAQVLRPLGPDGNRLYRPAIFDYRTDSPINLPAERAPRNAVLLFDGVFLLRSELREHWDLTIFIDADFETTAARAIARDCLESREEADAIRIRYQQRYIPGQRLYLESCKPRQNANIVVDNNDFLRPALTILDSLG
jgi:uridine kinase